MVRLKIVFLRECGFEPHLWYYMLKYTVIQPLSPFYCIIERAFLVLLTVVSGQKGGVLNNLYLFKGYKMGYKGYKMGYKKEGHYGIT